PEVGQHPRLRGSPRATFPYNEGRDGPWSGRAGPSRAAVGVVMARKRRKPDGEPAGPSGSGSGSGPGPDEPDAGPEGGRPGRGDGPSPRRPKLRPRRAARPWRVPPEWREVEVAMWRMLGRDAPPDLAEGSPRGRASEILHRAFRAHDARQVVTLAR